jgi:hypothetical protein
MSGFWLTVFVPAGWIVRGKPGVSSNVLPRAAFLSEMYSLSGDNEEPRGWSSVGLEKRSDEDPWLACSLFAFICA